MQGQMSGQGQISSLSEIIVWYFYWKNFVKILSDS